VCPLMSYCEAHLVGDAELFPTKPPRKVRKREQRYAALIRNSQGEICLGRRHPNALLGGLWCLPSVEGTHADTLTQLGLIPGQTLGEIEHGFTHKIWTMTVVESHGQPRGQEFEKFRYFSVEEINELGLSGPSLKALRAVGEKIRHRRGAGQKKEKPTTSV